MTLRRIFSPCYFKGIRIAWVFRDCDEISYKVDKYFRGKKVKCVTLYESPLGLRWRIGGVPPTKPRHGPLTLCGFPQKKEEGRGVSIPSTPRCGRRMEKRSLRGRMHTPRRNIQNH